MTMDLKSRLFNSLPNCFSDEMNFKLVKPISIETLDVATSSMAHGKALTSPNRMVV
jgi:hypothetical protein